MTETRSHLEGLAGQAGPSGLHTYNPSDYNVPVDEAGEWIDAGHWREAGVTHWHLSCKEWNMSDTARFSTEGALLERKRSPEGVARSPREVADWSVEVRGKSAREHGLTDEMLKSSGLLTEEDWQLREETAFRMAMFGRDVQGVLALKGGRILHINAYAQTQADCSSSH